jgi:hypothetical protein
MVKSKSRSIYTMAKMGRNTLEKVKKYLKKGNNLIQNSILSIRIVAAATVVPVRNSGVGAVFIC